MVESRVHVDVTCSGDRRDRHPMSIKSASVTSSSQTALAISLNRFTLLDWTNLSPTSHDQSSFIATQRSEERGDCQKVGISTDMILYFATCPTCSQTDAPLSSNRNPLDHLTQDDRPSNAGKLKGPLWNASRCFLSATSCFLTSMIHSDRV